MVSSECRTHNRSCAHTTFAGTKRRPLTLLVNLVVILLGVVGAAIGTSMSIIELVY